MYTIVSGRVHKLLNMFGGCRKSRTSCRLMCLPDWLNDQWNIYWMIYIDLYSIWNSPWSDFMLEWLLTRGLIECSLLKYLIILSCSILFYGWRAYARECAVHVLIVRSHNIKTHGRQSSKAGFPRPLQWWGTLRIFANRPPARAL